MGGKSSKPFVPVNLINNNEITKEQYEALKSFFESTNIEVKTNVKDGKKNIIKTESKTLAAALGVVFGEDGNITVPQGDVKSIDIAVQDNDTLKQNLETLRSSFGITLDALKSDRGGCGLVGKIFKLLSVSIQGQQEYKFLTKSEKITADKIKEVLEELKKVKVQEVIVLNNKEPGAAYENQDKKNQEIVLPKDQYGNNILGKHTNNQGQVGANNQDQVGANNEKPEGAGKNPNKENNTLEQCKEDDRFKTFLSYLITNLECFKIDDDEGRFYFDVCLKKQPNNETMFSKMDNNEKGMFYCYNNNDEKIFITTENWQTILEKVKIRSSNSPVQEQVNRINGLIGEWKNKQNNKQNLNNNKEVGANNEKEGAVENPKKEEEKKEEENPEGGENKEEENPNQVGGESQDNNQNLEGGEENNNKEGAVENEKRRNGVGNLKITNIIDTLEILKPNKSSKSLTHIKLENLGEADIHFKSKNNQNKEEEKLKDKDNKEENKENQEDKEEKEKDKKLKNPVAGKAENNNKEGAVENPVGVGENNKDNNNKKELKDLSEGKGTLEKDIEALKSAKEEAEKKMEELNEVLDI
ncbi:MAG: hypothetical protein RL208_287, partial [Pseudomonadota bacterium]